MSLQGYLWLFLFALVSGCSSNKSDEKFNVFTSNFDFSASDQGWAGDITDYNIKDSLQSAIKSEYANLSAAQVASQNSLKLTGNNLGDNLFLFIKTKVTDLKPNTEYTLVFEVQLFYELEVNQTTSNVYLKVGASTQEPKKIIEGDFYRINIDKGDGGDSGKDMVVMGTIANSSGIQNYSINENSLGYNTNPSIRAKTNDKGELWLIVGADSFSKGKNTIYYTSTNVVYSVSN